MAALHYFCVDAWSSDSVYCMPYYTHHANMASSQNFQLSHLNVYLNTTWLWQWFITHWQNLFFWLHLLS